MFSSNKILQHNLLQHTIQTQLVHSTVSAYKTDHICHAQYNNYNYAYQHVLHTQHYPPHCLPQPSYAHNWQTQSSSTSTTSQHAAKWQELHKKGAATARNTQRTNLPHWHCRCWHRAIAQEKIGVLWCISTELVILWVWLPFCFVSWFTSTQRLYGYIKHRYLWINNLSFLWMHKNFIIHCKTDHYLSCIFHIYVLKE